MRSWSYVLIAICFSAGFSVVCTAQTRGKRNAPPRSDQSSGQQSQTQQTQAQENQPQQSTSQPRDSSSKDNKIDLSPPRGDDVAHRDDDAPDDSSVMETKPWNPHKAAKDIEVGDFYAKRKNYRAAIDRYREALEYKPRDAEATFKLAQALEAVKETTEALKRYQEYLVILPKGEFAAESQKAIERLKPKS